MNVVEYWLEWPVLHMFILCFTVPPVVYPCLVLNEKKGTRRFKLMNRRPIEQRLQFETRLKHGLFYLKLYLVFRDLSRCSIGTGFMVIQPRFKFF